MVSQPHKTLLWQGEASSLKKEQGITRVLLKKEEKLLTKPLKRKGGRNESDGTGS
jgi:hypothetical protein